jgi:hypothetical protein
VRGKSRYRPNRYRAEKMRDLQLTVDVLKAEQDRLYILLADALVFACGEQFEPTGLLKVLAAGRGFNLARPHYFERREREAAARRRSEANAYWTVPRLLTLLRDTDPDRILGRRAAA